MWQHQSHDITKFKDIHIRENRHPVILQLEAAFLNQKPKNPLYFVKKWSQQQLKEAQSSEDEQEELNKQQIKQKRTKKANFIQIKRRNAIMMAQSEQTEQWVVFLSKQPLLKNEECKSRIMISLRQIPFLINLGWDDINQLVQEAQIREFYQNEIFISKGQSINRLYILIQGQIAINDHQKQIKYIEGQSLFVESIISLVKAKYNFYVTSQKAWICGIQSFRIYELIQSASKRKQQFYERILMAIGLFNYLDRQQFYKLYCLVQLMQIKKPNEIIIQQNDQVDKIYLVLKGEFIFCKKNLGGEITSYQTYRQGHFFGEEWIIRPVQSDVMVVSKTDGLLGVISRKDVEESISSIDKLLLRKRAKKIQNY